MKFLAKILLTASLLTAASQAVAGPGPQFWNRPAAKPFVAAEPARPAVQPDSSGLLCRRMLVPRVGTTKQSPVTVVICTPEMMKNDWRCQQACAQATKD